MSSLGLLGFFPILIYLFIFGLFIFFMVRAIRFMDEKTRLEKERNAKLHQIATALDSLKKKDE